MIDQDKVGTLFLDVLRWRANCCGPMAKLGVGDIYDVMDYFGFVLSAREDLAPTWISVWNRNLIVWDFVSES